MAKKKTLLSVVLILIFSCFVMYVVDIYIPFNYFQKSFVKIMLFAALPIAYCLYDKNINLKDFLQLKSKKQLLVSLLLGIAVYVIIIGAYFIFKSFIDLETISNSLINDLKVSGKNFIYVAIYISFINSFLEEFFFRGFTFFSLKKLSSRKVAYILSSLAFSLYHVAIILSWFNVFIFILILIGLALGGAIFNLLNEKNGNIFNSWLVHMFANFAINSIGIYMFYF